MTRKTSVDLIIGYGEVGQALETVLKERYTIHVHDPSKGRSADASLRYEWMHIAIPFGPTFVADVVGYTKLYKPEHTVIHSTVPVGTTRSIPYPFHVTFSPVRGIHPDLVRYIREFPKWFATTDDTDAVLEHFQSCGISMRLAPSIEALEWFKLVETTEYAYRIVLWQEFERQAKACEVRGGASKTDVISALKHWLYEKRKAYDGDRGLAPIMFGGPIRGHCLMPNIELLSPLMTKELYSWLTRSNALREEEEKDGQEPK